jgi:hypothetical protein
MLCNDNAADFLGLLLPLVASLVATRVCHFAADDEPSLLGAREDEGPISGLKIAGPACIGGSFGVRACARTKTGREEVERCCGGGGRERLPASSCRRASPAPSKRCPTPGREHVLLFTSAAWQRVEKPDGAFPRSLDSGALARSWRAEDATRRGSG